MKSIWKVSWFVLLAVVLSSFGCGSAPEPETKAEPEAVVEKKEEIPEPLTGTPVVVMKTTKGTVRMELYPEKAQETVVNFLRYVDAKFYDHTIFHLVIRRAMVQGGGYTWAAAGMKRKHTRGGIKNESQNGLKNVKGSVAMFRGETPDSATSQFFVNLRNNSKLDAENRDDGFGYCVFGKVIEGMKVIEAIGKMETHEVRGQKNVPTVPIFISRIRREG